MTDLKRHPSRAYSVPALAGVPQIGGRAYLTIQRKVAHA